MKRIALLLALAQAGALAFAQGAPADAAPLAARGSSAAVT